MLKYLEGKNKHLFEFEDIAWRLKRHVIQLEEGDNNTKFFHKHAAYRKTLNTIWEIKNPDGVKVPLRILWQLVKIVFYPFLRKVRSNIGEIVKVVRLFPRFFDGEMSEVMDSSVTAKELKSVPSSFKKEKILGPDNQTVKFFIEFLDFMKEDLLKVVEESKKSSKILTAIKSFFIALIQRKTTLRPLNIIGIFHYAIFFIT